MGKSKIVTIRLDTDTLNEIKKYGSVSSLIKKALRVYLESPQAQSSATLPEDVEKLLSEFKDRLTEYVAKVKGFCEEHAKIITENHEAEKYKFDYWRDVCLHRYRRITRSNLNVYVQDKLLKKINIYSLNKEEKEELERRINELIESTVNAIYPSPYPPLYPK